MKPTKPYPYLYVDVDRQGQKRWRLRAPHRPTVTIKGVYGSPDYAANYRAAIEGTTAIVPVGTSKHGTLSALTRSYLRSADFVQLAPESKRKRRLLVEQFALELGDLPVARLERQHVRAIMDRYATRPGTARVVLSALRVLVAFAIDSGIEMVDPTIGFKRPKLSAEGWHTWSETEITTYEDRHPVGSMARLALLLAVCTGQRTADLIKMGKQHVRDGKISVTQQKTGMRLWVPLHSDLQAAIDATSSNQLTLLLSEKGQPYASAMTFSHALHRWAKEAGLAGLSAAWTSQSLLPPIG